jgi:hypothetical protein
MLRIAGYWWMVVSMIHACVGAIIFFNQWVAIAQDNWINAITQSSRAEFRKRSCILVHVSHSLHLSDGTTLFMERSAESHYSARDRWNSTGDYISWTISVTYLRFLVSITPSLNDDMVLLSNKL